VLARLQEDPELLGFRLQVPAVVLKLRQLQVKVFSLLPRMLQVHGLPGVLDHQDVVLMLQAGKVLTELFRETFLIVLLSLLGELLLELKDLFDLVLKLLSQSGDNSLLDLQLLDQGRLLEGRRELTRLITSRSDARLVASTGTVCVPVLKGQTLYMLSRIIHVYNLSRLHPRCYLCDFDLKATHIQGQVHSRCRVLIYIKCVLGVEVDL
jgi:hypothetical protein